MKDYAITLAIVVVGVILAAWVSKKIGLNSYEEYETFENAGE
jgi:hypothetical protein